MGMNSHTATSIVTESTLPCSEELCMASTMMTMSVIASIQTPYMAFNNETKHPLIYTVPHGLFHASVSQYFCIDLSNKTLIFDSALAQRKQYTRTILPTITEDHTTNHDHSNSQLNLLPIPIQQKSSYSSLAHALTPRVSIIDYQSSTVHTISSSDITGGERLGRSEFAVSRYSSLAGALG
jgi:hypothetical protein